MRRPYPLAAALLLAPVALAVPAHASWRLVKAEEVREIEHGGLVVTAAGEWNRSTSDVGKRGEAWTRNGRSLDDLSFFGGIRPGESLFRTDDRKRRPLPLFEADFLPTDIAEWYRDTANIVLGGSLFALGEVRPATLAGHQGVHFTYRYTGGDNVERLGEARAAVIAGRLYLIAFDAPRLHCFDAGITAARAIMDSARLKPGR